MAHGLRRMFFWVFILLILLVPEISARLVSKPQSPFPSYPSYVEISHGYKHLNQLIQDWNASRIQYYDYYIYSFGPASSKTVNFTDYFGARATPASADLDEADEVIWAFGGSTMADLEADDDLSLANQIALELNKDNVKARVHNFGVGGFQSSLETIKFQDLLRRVPLRERPTTVIFYDGFNDVSYGYNFGAANLPRDMSLKLRDLVDRNYTRLLVYVFSELLSRHSVFWKDFIRNRINNRLYEGQTVNQDAENLDKTVSSYVVNVRMTRGICQEFHIRCLFILQPLVITKANPTSVER
ncbi:MAG: SGNH/GDSL hydrolase family protein, partial [Nitrososphaera sp.]|nr:SGNH/GDSL hydrolase family protein [Nitrososphaera sp.]